MEMEISRRGLPKAAIFVGCAPLIGRFLEKSGSQIHPSQGVCYLKAFRGKIAPIVFSVGIPWVPPKRLFFFLAVQHSKYPGRCKSWYAFDRATLPAGVN